MRGSSPKKRLLEIPLGRSLLRNALSVCLTVCLLALVPASSVGSSDVTTVDWAGIDMSANGHEQGRHHTGSGTAVSVSTGDPDTSRPDIDDVGDAQVRASLTPAK